MPTKGLTAKQFLKEQGIDLKLTTLIIVIDGHMRQPDLVNLLEQFASKKCLEVMYPSEKPDIVGKPANELKTLKNPKNPPDEYFSPY